MMKLIKDLQKRKEELEKELLEIEDEISSHPDNWKQYFSDYPDDEYKEKLFERIGYVRRISDENNTGKVVYKGEGFDFEFDGNEYEIIYWRSYCDNQFEWNGKYHYNLSKIMYEEPPYEIFSLKDVIEEKYGEVAASIAYALMFSYGYI